MASNIKGIIVEIGGDTSGLQKALSKVNSASSSLSKELRGINSLLKLDPKNTELVAQKQTLLAQNINETSEKLKILKQTQKEADDAIKNGTKISDENYRNLQREIINTEEKLKNLKVEASKWTTAGREIEEYGNKIKSLGNKIDDIGNKLTTRLTLPVATGFTLMTKYAIENETAIQQVNKIYGESAQVIKDFAENTAIAFNMSSSDAYKYAQIYGNLIQSITDDQAENAKYTQQLLEASSIIASATGRTMEDVMDRIRSGLLGNTEAIEDLGVNVNVALLETTDAFKKFAGDKSWNKLDFQTQQQIRLFGILEQTTKKYGKEINKNTASSIQQLTAKTKNLTTDLGKKLLPIANDLLEKANELIDKFGDLSDEEQQNIIKIGLMVAAAGPLLKIAGTGVSLIGQITKGVGLFSQALAVATNRATSNVKSVNNLSNAIKSLTSPVGLATTAIGLTAGAILYMNEKAKEIPETLQTAINEMKDYKEEHKSFREEIDKTSASNMAEIANIEELKDELSTLVDENGRVKESYKDRVNFILKELNEALGTEYSMTGNIIEQYKTLQDEIETLILKKKAQIILENEEAKYSEAIANKEEAYQKMINAQNEYNEALEGKTYEQYFEELKQNYIDAGYTAEKSAEHAKSYMAKWVDGYKQNYEDARQIHNDYLKDIAAYENDYAIIQSENNEKIQELIKRRSFSYEQSSADIGETINHNIQQVQYEMQQYKNAYNQDLKYQDEYNAKKNKAQIDAGQKHLETLTQQLIESISTVKEMTPQQVEAWKNLAQNSFDIYKKYVNNMEPEMQEEIQEVTGVLINNTSVTDAATNLASNAKNAFNKNLDGRASGENFVEGVRIGMNARSAALVATSWALGKKTLSSFNDSLDEHSPSELSKESGVNFVQGVIDGIILKRIEALNLIEKLGKDLIKKFSLNYDKNMLNYNAPDASFFNKTIESSKTIFTTPTLNIYTQDELTPTKINSIIDAVNRRLGSKY